MFQVVQSLAGRKMCGLSLVPQPQGDPLNCHAFWLPRLSGSVRLSPATAWTVSGPPNSHDFEGRGPLAGGLLEAASDPI